MELFVARQPIFDAHMHVCAYEVLFRSGQRNEFDGTEENIATAKVISAIFGSPECEHLSADKPVFLNFPRALLLSDAASILPSRETVIEILETVEPDEAVIEACEQLRARGYRLALDDFVPGREPHPLEPLVDILKIDFRLAKPSQQKAAARKCSRRPQLLAEKVETQEEFLRAARMGYEYFQGYFFARPVITSTREIPGVKLNYLRMLGQLHEAELDFGKIAALLKREHALSYKLLRFVNSAMFSRPVPIASLRQAVTFIGEEALRKWLSVVLLMDLTADRPSELAVGTLMRARFAELLALDAGWSSRSQDCFLMGMFSRLDAMLGRPLEELLEGLSLQPEIPRALLNQGRPRDRFPALWRLVQAYEAGDWEAVGPLAESLHIRPEHLIVSYTEAVRWADTACAHA